MVAGSKVVVVGLVEDDSASLLFLLWFCGGVDGMVAVGVFIGVLVGVVLVDTRDFSALERRRDVDDLAGTGCGDLVLLIGVFWFFFLGLLFLIRFVLGGGFLVGTPALDSVGLDDWTSVVVTVLLWVLLLLLLSSVVGFVVAFCFHTMVGSIRQ